MFPTKCWVPHCNARKDLEPNRNFFPLPSDPKYKETWIALTGKKLISEKQVFFCDAHFRQQCFETVSDRVIRLVPRALPYYKMPQMICRTCMTTIISKALFCVVSATIPSPVPPEHEVEFVQCRAEPLYQILTFCIPNLNLEQNPPSLVCIKCYDLIWQYFIFKLTCNSLENRIRGSLSPEEYGKLVLCRGCPATSGTRFFFLNETQPMGEVLMKMFLTNYPTNIVPLKLCLKCWNLLFKLTQFHQQCLTLDQIMQRCADISQIQMYNKTALPNSSVNQCPQNLVESLPSTSKCSSDLSQSYFNKSLDIKKTDVDAVKSGEMMSKKYSETKLLNVGRFQTDPEMPKLLPQVGIESEPKPKFNLHTTSFTVEFKLLLAKLVHKHSSRIRPDLNPIEQVKADLEMWVNVMNEIHSLGHMCTLISIQSLWSKMINHARRARRNIGAMTYLDYLVNSCNANVSMDDVTDNSGIIVLDDTESCDNNLTERNNTAGTSVIVRATKTYMPMTVPANSNNKETITIQSLLRRPMEGVTVTKDGVICIDDDSDTEGSSTNNFGKDVENAGESNTQVNNCDVNRTENNDLLDKMKKTSDALRQFRIKSTVKRSNPRHSESLNDSKRNKGKLKRQWIRQALEKKGRLELVREMRKEYNSLIEERQLNSLRSPWKSILQRLAGKGFKGGADNFPKMYSEWGKMKTSATIYEKNGKDIVDNEVWDLLQLYKKVQNNLIEKRKNEGDTEDVLENKDRCNQSETPSKRPKLMNSDFKGDNSKDSVNSLKTSGKAAVTSDIKNPAKREHRKTINSLSDNEKLEILELIEKELTSTMLANGGVIKESFTTILNNITYRNHSVSAITSLWQKLAMDASVQLKTKTKNLTDVHQKVLKVLSMYRQNKVSKKVNVFSERESKTQEATVKETVSSTSTKRRGRPSKYNDKERLDLISVIKSYGNEVFKKIARSERLKFWSNVATKFNDLGYTVKPTEIYILWGHMLRSAKLTWAQADRKPVAGDQEIIDFMTEVIKDKEKSTQSSQLDFNVEGDEGVEDDSNNSKENLNNSEEDSNGGQENCEMVSKEDIENYKAPSDNKQESLHVSASDFVKNIEEMKGSDESESENVTSNKKDLENYEEPSGNKEEFLHVSAGDFVENIEKMKDKDEGESENVTFNKKDLENSDKKEEFLHVSAGDFVKNTEKMKDKDECESENITFNKNLENYEEHSDNKEEFLHVSAGDFVKNREKMKDKDEGESENVTFNKNLENYEEPSDNKKEFLHVSAGDFVKNREKMKDKDEGESENVTFNKNLENYEEPSDNKEEFLHVSAGDFVKNIEEMKDSNEGESENVTFIKRDLENHEEPLHNKEFLHVSAGDFVKDLEEMEDSDEGESENDYDYVSLQDIQKEYGINISENPKPFVIEGVVEISDSEED